MKIVLFFVCLALICAALAILFRVRAKKRGMASRPVALPALIADEEDLREALRSMAAMDVDRRLRAISRDFTSFEWMEIAGLNGQEIFLPTYDSSLIIRLVFGSSMERVGYKNGKFIFVLLVDGGRLAKDLSQTIGPDLSTALRVLSGERRGPEWRFTSNGYAFSLTSDGLQFSSDAWRGPGVFSIRGGVDVVIDPREDEKAQFRAMAEKLAREENASREVQGELTALSRDPDKLRRVVGFTELGGELALQVQSFPRDRSDEVETKPISALRGFVVAEA